MCVAFSPPSSPLSEKSLVSIPTLQPSRREIGVGPFLPLVSSRFWGSQPPPGWQENAVPPVGWFLGRGPR